MVGGVIKGVVPSDIMISPPCHLSLITGIVNLNKLGSGMKPTTVGLRSPVVIVYPHIVDFRANRHMQKEIRWGIFKVTVLRQKIFRLRPVTSQRKTLKGTSMRVLLWRVISLTIELQL
jgi:hypothetical protein